MPDPRRLLVLYSAVPASTLACLETLATQCAVEIHLVRWSANPDAPYVLSPSPRIRDHARERYDDDSLARLAEAVRPHALYVAGWRDRAYLRVARIWRRRGVPVICAMDTQWRGGWRQRAAALLSPLFLHRRFTHAWVPGLPQYETARRLGFHPRRILTGLYSADTPRFGQAGASGRLAREGGHPRQLLFAGRLVAEKAVVELCQTFLGLGGAGRAGWELLIVGNGPLRDRLPSHDAVRTRPFVQPDELALLASRAGAGVLPSRHEPWGIVLHEFAAAGLPLVASDGCGAATALLRDGYNGFLHQAGDRASLEGALSAIFRAPDDRLQEMGERSRRLSFQYSPEAWATTCYRVMVEGAPPRTDDEP